MSPPARQSEPACGRGGFTMIELLVVLMIVAMLLSISWVVYGQAVESARVQATRATIRHLDGALQDRIEDFERLNFKPLATQYAAQTGLPMELALLMVKKDRFRASFPQREEDLWGFDGAPGGPDDSPLLQKMFIPGTSTPKPDSWLARNASSDPALAAAAESSELLYVALTEGSVFGPPPPDLDRIPARHIGDTDGDGNLEFLDEWGRPLRFYNWTTRLIRPVDAPNNQIQLTTFRQTVGVLMPDVIPPPSATLAAEEYSHPLNQDPDDVTGALGTSPPADFTEAYFHTIDTYHIPLIVSGGPDERVGLYEPDASDPRDPTAAAPTPAQFFRRLALPLGIDPSTGNVDAALLDLLYDNITNRQP